MNVLNVLFLHDWGIFLLFEGGFILSILLAVGEPSMANILRKYFEEGAFEVIDNDVHHRKYLNDILELENPNILILHDIYLPSDLHTKEDKEQELLTLINSWRVDREDMRVVFICERPKNDPFLGDLVAHNVLDIFNERQIIAKNFLEQLSAPPRYANVSKFKVGGLTLSFDETTDTSEVEQQEELDVEENNEVTAVPVASTVKKPKIDFSEKKAAIGKQLSERTQDLKELAGKVSLPKRNDTPKVEKEKIPKAKAEAKQEKQFQTELELGDIIEFMPIDRVQQRSAIIGTVLISVAGVVPHIGATHTAISIASYLKDLGHSVALVEGNESQDYDRIHTLYEGEKRMLSSINTFEMQGITHYKYRERQDLYEIFPLYEYVVLDLGSIQDTPYLEEFRRSHVKCVVCSGDEWKLHWIETFQKIYPNHEDVCYLIPGAVESVRKDLEERLEWRSVYSFPIQVSPYEPSTDVEEILYDVLGEFIKSPKKTFSRGMLIISSVASVAITVAVLGVFYIIG